MKWIRSYVDPPRTPVMSIGLTSSVKRISALVRLAETCEVVAYDPIGFCVVEGQYIIAFEGGITC